MAQDTGVPRFYGNLESLRGFCAIAVALRHTPWATNLREFAIVHQAWIFVDFFFVLSGFVIAVNYGTATRPMTPWPFLRSRFFRLYPLHLVTLLVSLAIILLRAFAFDDGWGDNILTTDYLGLIIQNLTLTHALGFSNRYILNVPSWSISTEMAAYATFALICVIAPSLRYRTLIIVLMVIASLAALLVFYPETGLEKPENFRLPRCLYSFGLGVLVARAVNIFPAVPQPATAFLQVGLFALMLAFVSIVPWGSLLTLFAPFIFAAIIYVAACDRSSWVKRGLEIPPLLFAGKISYSIYMVHSCVGMMLFFGANRLGLVARGTGQEMVGPYNDLLTALYAASVIAIAALSFRWIEKPWRDYGRQIGGKKQEPSQEGLIA